MLVKFISETEIKKFPGWIKENGIVYTNNYAEEKAVSYGYKELVTDEIPEYNFETQYLTNYYVDEAKCVRKCWRVNDVEMTELN